MLKTPVVMEASAMLKIGLKNRKPPPPSQAEADKPAEATKTTNAPEVILAKEGKALLPVYFIADKLTKEELARPPEEWPGEGTGRPSSRPAESWLTMCRFTKVAALRRRWTTSSITTDVIPQLLGPRWLVISRKALCPGSAGSVRETGKSYGGRDRRTDKMKQT